VIRSLSRRLPAGVGFLLVALSGCESRPTAPPQPPPTTTRAKVRVFWSVESSQNLYGFILYRGRSPQGPWTRISPAPILAAEGGTTNVPHDYSYVDSDESLVAGETYWYWLEGLDSDGSKRPVKWPPEKVVAKVPIDQEFPPEKKNDER
jgi:hypothetical protein